MLVWMRKLLWDVLFISLFVLFIRLKYKSLDVINADMQQVDADPLAAASADVSSQNHVSHETLQRDTCCAAKASNESVKVAFLPGRTRKGQPGSGAAGLPLPSRGASRAAAASHLSARRTRP